jgi:hypothetical protein
MNLVTGAPRSGTAWITKVLQHHGLHVKHEKISAHGTVNWQSAPYADNYVRRVAIVRHPLLCVASLLTISDASRDYLARHTGIEYRATEEWYGDVWAAWYEKFIIGKMPIFQLEALVKGHAPLWSTLLAKLGSKHPVDEAFIKSLPPQNTRVHKPILHCPRKAYEVGVLLGYDYEL